MDDVFLTGAPPWEKSEQLPRELLGARRGYHGRFQSRLCAVFGLEGPESQGDVPHDAGEKVVEIMCNSTGQKAEGFKLLRAKELVFGLLLFGNIPFEPPDSQQTVLADIADKGVLEELGCDGEDLLFCFKGLNGESSPNPVFVHLAAGSPEREERSERYPHDVDNTLAIIHAREFVVSINDLGIENAREQSVKIHGTVKRLRQSQLGYSHGENSHQLLIFLYGAQLFLRGEVLQLYQDLTVPCPV